MAKADLIEEAERLGIELSGDETVDTLEALIAEKKKGPTNPESVSKTAASRAAESLAEFGWAVNAVKLNRAKAKVQQNPETKALKGKELEAAVREAYVAMNGLVRGENVRAGGKRTGRVMNMADNDEE